VPNSHVARVGGLGRGWPHTGRRYGGAEGAVGRAGGAVVVTGCDRSRTGDWNGRLSFWVADSLATFEAGSWRLERSSWYSLRISESWVVTVFS